MLIEMKLEADMCPSSGESVPGLIDTDIATDELGFPIIPARRIKGCLKEAALEIRDALHTEFDEDSFLTLFGKSGGQEGALKIENGVLKGYEEMKKKIEELKGNKDYQTYFQKENITESYTYIRSQTSIDQNTGTALKDTLRSLRVIKKGLIFQIPVELETTDEKVKSFLRKCCKVLRHIGVNRTRGLGEVSCVLKEDDKKLTTSRKKTTSIVDVRKNKLCQLPYQLTLATPLITSQQIHSSSQTETYIPGSAILGAFASKFIRQHQLGNDAHKNKEFNHLFLSEHVKFLNAYPFDGKNVFYPMPLSFVQEKDKNKYYDLAFNKHQQKVEEEKIQTKKFGDYFAIHRKKFLSYTPKVIVEYHHQRPKNRKIGHATKDQGTFFQYVALKEEQIFLGSILGEKQDLEHLASLMKNKETIRIGRSKTAQYAKVKLQLESITDFQPSYYYDDNQCVITLSSPCIVRNPNTGMIDANPIHFINEIQKKYPVLSIQQYFISTTEIGGFNGKWGLPRIQCQALAAGSVFIFKINGSIEKSDLEQLAKESYGLRKNEGFGRVIVNHHGSDSIIITKADQELKRSLVEQDDTISHLTELLLTDIQKRKIREQVIERALGKQIIPFRNTLISKLVALLDTVDSKEKFEQATYIHRDNELSTIQKKRLQTFWDFYNNHKFENEKGQIRLSQRNVLTDDAQEYLDSWEVEKFYYKTIFQQMRFINREKKQVVKNEQ